MKEKIYYYDYEKEPIGGGNPYYRCTDCKISDPQINGRLDGHAEWCEYRIQKERELTIKELLDSFLNMCDFIEKTDEIGCGKCPVYDRCFHHDKHKGLVKLMEDLGVEVR